LEKETLQMTLVGKMSWYRGCKVESESAVPSL